MLTTHKLLKRSFAPHLYIIAQPIVNIKFVSYIFVFISVYDTLIYDFVFLFAFTKLFAFEVVVTNC